MRREREAGPALARLDVIQTGQGRAVDMMVFAPSAIVARVISTFDAPNTVQIEPRFVQEVQSRLGAAAGLFSDRIKMELPLESAQAMEAKQSPTGRHAADICFASLGWVAVSSLHEWTITPYNVAGSKCGKREPSLYPRTLARMMEEERETEGGEEGGYGRRGLEGGREGGFEGERDGEGRDDWREGRWKGGRDRGRGRGRGKEGRDGGEEEDPEQDLRKRLREAAETGRHDANRRRERKESAEVEVGQLDGLGYEDMDELDEYAPWR
jgi:hypothetical protein